VTRAVWLGAAICVVCAGAPLTADAQSTAAGIEAAPELKASLPSAKLIGQGRLRVWGFEVYDARLWAAPGFKAGDVSGQPFALELAYLRDLKASDIAASSIKEMRRAQAVEEDQAGKWVAELLRVIPTSRKATA
jgi:hypothetical protein